MRVTNQITFTAKDDAEALRLAAERLGRDAVILSTQIIKEGGVLGMFKRSVLKVTAGILEDDTPKPAPKNNIQGTASSISSMDEQTRRENLIAFQKLMEFKERTSIPNSNQHAQELGNEGYRAEIYNPDTITGENIKISQEGLRNAYGLKSSPQQQFSQAQNSSSYNQNSATALNSQARNSSGYNQDFARDNQDLMTGQNSQARNSASYNQDLSSGQNTQARNSASYIQDLSSGQNAQARNSASYNQDLSSGQNAQARNSASYIQDLSSGQNISGQENSDAKILREQVSALADRLDLLIERISVIEKREPVRDNMNVSEWNYHQNSKTDPDGIEARLRASEIDEKYIRKILADYAIAVRKEKGKKIQFKKWLGAQIPCSADGGNDPMGGRKVMLIGPTGVGKTTTIAKLAAIKALWEHKKVLLLTSDTYRIAAVEQLKTYAKILGVPIEIIFDIKSIPEAANKHENADIILLDTAGRSQRDIKNMKMFEEIYNSYEPDAVHLVLSANMKYGDMVDVVEHIPNIPVTHLLFTKLDETVSYGGIFNIQQVTGCPVSYLTVGQNVPKDIETASGEKLASYLLSRSE